MTTAITGSLQFLLDGGRIGITSEDTQFLPFSILQVRNYNSVGAGMVVESWWEGSEESPFTNNDTTLFVTYTKTLSDSANRSWSASCCNAYRNIPEGVTDMGEAVGIIGWAGSVAVAPDYIHAGTLGSQVGVKGTAGFQGPGSAPTAVVTNADGVAGLIYADSEGATITTARAGTFTSDGGPSTILTNMGVYSRASGGTTANYSFYGDAGLMFNRDRIAGKYAYSQSSPAFSARNNGGNSFEFGYEHSSNLGATGMHGYPFLAFCAEADVGGNTYRTRGAKGAIVSSDLSGALIFARVTDADAEGQTPTETARFTADGLLIMALPAYADNAAALLAGLPVNAWYKTPAGEVRIVV